MSALNESLCEFFDQDPRRGGPHVVLIQQIGCMFGQLIGVAAQSNPDAAVAYGWFENHGKADLRDSAFYLLRIRRQAISRYRYADLLKELTLNKFVATSLNRCGVRSRQQWYRSYLAGNIRGSARQNCLYRHGFPHTLPRKIVVPSGIGRQCNWVKPKTLGCFHVEKPVAPCAFNQDERSF